jgi:hypothetical protein
MRHVASLRRPVTTPVPVNPRTPATGGYSGSSAIEIVQPGASCTFVGDVLACGSCRTCGKRKKRVSHEVLGRRERMRRPQAPQALLLDSLAEWKRT